MLRFWLRDDQFERIEVMLPGKRCDPGRTATDNHTADDGGGGDATPKDKKESVGGKKLPYRYGNQKNAVPRQPKFKRKCDELKGHV